MTIEIYWDDLTKEKQNEIIEMFDDFNLDETNWDIIPMTVFELDDDD